MDPLQSPSEARFLSGNNTLSFKLPQTTAEMPLLGGILGGGALGSGLAFTIFTLAHAVLAGGKRRKRSNRDDMPNSEDYMIIDHPEYLDDMSLPYSPDLQFQTTDDPIVNYEHYVSQRNVKDTHPQAENRFYDKDQMDMYEEEENRTQNLRNEYHTSRASFLNDLRSSFNVSDKLETDILKTLTDDDKLFIKKHVPSVKGSKYYLDKSVLKHVEKEIGQDLRTYVDNVFVELSKQDCSLIRDICKIATEAGRSLTDAQRKSLRSLQLSALRLKSKDKNVRRMLSVITTLLYASNRGCKKISRRCFYLSSMGEREMAALR